MRAALVALIATTAAAAGYGDLLFPTNSALRAACKAGYQNYADPAAIGRYLVRLEPFPDSVLFQPPAGSVYSLCAGRALALDPMPDMNEANFVKSLALLMVSGTVRDLAEARGWAAALIVRSANGAELARMKPFPLNTRAGDARDWKADGRTLSGFNQYGFLFLEDKFQAAALKTGSTIWILLQRNRQIKEYKLPTAATGVSK